MRDHFRNISMIMDCVACEKCKMWAKLEMLGLATAFKIVLDDNESSIKNLQRNEVIVSQECVTLIYHRHLSIHSNNMRKPSRI